MGNSQNKVALVTGSATGIGRETALLLADRGFDVAVNYSKSETDAAETANEIKRRGRRAILCCSNVADDAAVRAMLRRCADELGGLDVLVNNAGTTHFIKHTELDSLTEEIWDEILAVNLKGASDVKRAMPDGPLVTRHRSRSWTNRKIIGLADRAWRERPSSPHRTNRPAARRSRRVLRSAWLHPARRRDTTRRCPASL